MSFSKTAMTISLAGLAALASIGIGCSDDGSATGTLGLELCGEEYIEDGIPATEFEDGYVVTFDKFLINLGEITVAKEGSSPAIDEQEMRVWDLTMPGPFDLASAEASTGHYDHTAYSITGATVASVSGNATDDDLQLMIDEGYSVYVVGSATDGATTKIFAWGFHTETVYDPCHSEAVLDDGSEATVQITIHGDHLFYDDAVSTSPGLLFSEIALADANDDSEVTASELVDHDITTLSNYGVGSLDIFNMWDFISHMTTTLGHIDGEGHCE